MIIWRPLAPRVWRMSHSLLVKDNLQRLVISNSTLCVVVDSRLQASIFNPIHYIILISAHRPISERSFNPHNLFVLDVDKTALLDVKWYNLYLKNNTMFDIQNFECA